MKGFFVSVEDSKVTRDYFKEVRARLEKPDFLRVPFEKGKKVKHEGSGVYYVELVPAYPPVYWLGFALFIGGFLIFGASLILIFPLLLGFTGVLWSKTFQYLGLRKGLRRAGYEGKIRRLRAWGR